MSDTTNGTAGAGARPPSLNDMWNALERLREVPSPPTEYRLHPDDLKELQTQARWVSPQIHDIDFQPLTHFGGLRLVADPSAPRLPRR